MATLEDVELVVHKIVRVKDLLVPRWLGVYWPNGSKAAIKVDGGFGTQMLEYGPDSHLTQPQVDELVAGVAAHITKYGPVDVGQDRHTSADDVAAAQQLIAKWRQNPDYGLDMNLYRRVNAISEEAARRGEGAVNAIQREWTRGRCGRLPEPLPEASARRYYRTAKALGFPCGDPDATAKWSRAAAERIATALYPDVFRESEQPER
jgi:hypothetical protein